jgi:3'-5' exoribonuclease
MTLGEVQQRAAAQDAPEFSRIPLQVEAARSGTTAAGKPYYDLEVADATGRAKFKIWSDAPAFRFCERLQGGEFCELGGSFFSNQYGLNVQKPELRLLEEDEVEALLAGSEEARRKREADWAYVRGVAEGMAEGRLRATVLRCLADHEAKWLRAAAARTYHHARRGGLLEHTAQMLRCAQALAPLYAEVNADLLASGVIFHDVGKLWENDYPERGFTASPCLRGELIGHIAIGVEVANRCWNLAREAEPALFAGADSERVREHLLHLIVAHHGELEFGSPVVPKSPEAFLLHHIDNIDAKIEMLRGAYAAGAEVVPGLVEARRPLSGLVARPLGQGQSTTNGH